MRTLTNKTLLAAFAALTLGAMACNRSSDKASETNTTSAPAPAAQDPSTPMNGDQSGVAPSMPTAPVAPVTPSVPQQTGPSRQLPSSRGSMTTGTQNNAPTNPNSGTALPSTASTLNTPPGHIMYPPDKAPVPSDDTSSNGSHDIGAGSVTPRR